MEESDGEKIDDGKDAQNSQIQNEGSQQMSCMRKTEGVSTKISNVQDMLQAICSERRNTGSEKIELVGRGHENR